MSRKHDPDLFAPLIARFQDDLRMQARAIAADIMRAEIEHRQTVLATLDQAFDTALSKTRVQSPKSNDRVTLAKGRRAAAVAVSRDSGVAPAIDPQIERTIVMDVGPSTSRSSPRSAPVIAPLVGARVQDALAEAVSRVDDEASATEGAVVADATTSLPVVTPARPTAGERLARARARRSAAEVASRGGGAPSGNEPKDEQEQSRTTGTVKWFNDAKGFGFIMGPDGGEEVFVHFKHVVGDGFRTLVEGASVSYVLREGPRGRFAIDVRSAGNDQRVR